MTRIAVYMRLSKEDECEKGDESNSIQNQRTLLEQYIKVHFTDYELFEFQDDGYTGTNFKRPDVTRLLNQVKECRIDCIIVKDFSRFSRDYIEMGTYIEQVFPFMGVRFISVNDHYDSNNTKKSTGDLDIAFKHLLYDFYSKDLSVKVKTSLAAKKAQGLYVSANSPFGYEKDPENRHMLHIVEDEAAVVRRIFGLTKEGYTSSQIAKKFNEEKIKTPLQFKLEKGKSTRVPKGGTFLWESGVICEILRNVVYVGDIVYGKYEKTHVGGKNHLKPREEWKTYCGHHEPVIDRETFESIQKNRGKNIKRLDGKAHPLVGKLVCGCCNKNLTYRKSGNYFYCQKRYTNGKKGCIIKQNAMFLEEMMLYLIRQELLKFANREQLAKEQEAVMQKQKKEMLIRINKKKQQLLMYKQEKIKTYEMYSAERDIENNDRKAKDCLVLIAKKQQEAENELTELEMKYETYVKSIPCQMEWYLNQLTQEITDALIQKVVITDEMLFEIVWNYQVMELV